MWYRLCMTNNTDHKPESEIVAMLQAAAAQVEVGAYYAHYKHPELTYRIKDLVIWEATDEVAVIYEAQYGERITFARALSVWLETVEWEGGVVPRFTKVTKA
jgi:hypothetical protein